MGSQVTNICYKKGKLGISAATKYSCVQIIRSGSLCSLLHRSARSPRRHHRRVQCTTVNIDAFTVPAGQTFNLDLLEGTTVNVLGEIQFGNLSWAGPLFEVKGTNVTFNGNGQIWDGGGPFYWDGLGTNGGVTKPRPMMKIEISGTLSDVHVVNAPAQCFSLTNPGPLVVSGIIVDDSQGNYPNANSNGLPAGHNTDGFDVSGNDLVVEKSVVINQVPGIIS
ncbi:hypothetical protein L210DRAFT_2727394 [Boletus edulis BED1]|uniref:Endopolygalacturonase n=1 Tax=Boletus edulis BED1 TaxID=1328754 RepID=A0AAD4G547_BOLED|nr:hypothetical protein L210DRAFT_2727394 [Boletus edulis BED1]